MKKQLTSCNISFFIPLENALESEEATSMLCNLILSAASIDKHKQTSKTERPVSQSINQNEKLPEHQKQFGTLNESVLDPDEASFFSSVTSNAITKSIESTFRTGTFVSLTNVCGLSCLLFLKRLFYFFCWF